jgi:sigma-B regulation protein RsbU (phosphoserine phosphatase)
MAGQRTSIDRTLIVDGSPKARLLIESMLRARGYNDLTSVEAAGKAFVVLGLEPDGLPGALDVGLILMDLLMPEIDGLEACRLIHSAPEFADTPLIRVTADSAERLKETFDDGAIDYVEKPVNRVELAARVHSALRLRKHARRLVHRHDLKGSGGGYGFNEISTIGKSIEEAAKRSDGEAIAGGWPCSPTTWTG